MSLTARALMVAAVAGGLLAACDDAPPAKASGEVPAASKPKAPESLLPPHMVAAVSSGKTATMLGVHFALDSPPTVGKPLTVDIAIVPHDSFTSLHGLFEAPEALSLITGTHFEQKTNVKPETVLPHKLSLFPSQEGVFLITAAVESEGGEGTVTRIFSIPVIVKPAGSPAPAAAAAGSPPAP